jgi:hypothetical protein
MSDNKVLELMLSHSFGSAHKAVVAGLFWFMLSLSGMIEKKVLVKCHHLQHALT